MNRDRRQGYAFNDHVDLSVQRRPGAGADWREGHGHDGGPGRSSTLKSACAFVANLSITPGRDTEDMIWIVAALRGVVRA